MRSLFCHMTSLLSLEVRHGPPNVVLDSVSTLLLVSFRIDDKIILLVYKTLNGFCSPVCHDLVLWLLLNAVHCCGSWMKEISYSIYLPFSSFTSNNLSRSTRGISKHEKPEVRSHHMMGTNADQSALRAQKQKYGLTQCCILICSTQMKRKWNAEILFPNIKPLQLCASSFHCIFFVCVYICSMC